MVYVSAVRGLSKGAGRVRGRRLEFELTDIFEKVSIYGGELERRIEENIKYVLAREGLYRPGMTVVIPAGALYWECRDYRCWFTADFEVFDRSDRRVAVGRATGDMAPVDDRAVELQSMEIRLWLEES